MKAIMFILLLPFVGTASNNDAASLSRTPLYQYLVIKSFLNSFYSPISSGKTAVHVKDVIHFNPEIKIIDKGKNDSYRDTTINRISEKPTYQHSYANRRMDQEGHSILFFLNKVTGYVTKPGDKRIIDEFFKQLINA